MDLGVECESSTLMGSLFQQIINDLKNTSPLWEDFVSKTTKLHSCLRAVIQAIASYLDAFQKIADAATNSRGASKEIGTALTRVCLRHKAVETRMKTFTSAIMDCLVIPLQENLEDWKRQVAAIDKEHSKEYKRCRMELKKRSNDTLRLQKKARKDQSDTIQSLVDSYMQDVSMRRAELEEVERKSLRTAMIEERMRYCSFVNMLQPVVKEECEVMSELGHLQEAMESIANVTQNPNVLPQSSEEIILEAKPSINLYPESPGGGSNSLGSRKSSVCSISSVNSSGSSNNSPGNNFQRSLSQLISPTMRLKPGESSDSGFCSSPVLAIQSSTHTSQSPAVSTWPPHTQEVAQATDRPHTISSAYERGHQRPALTVYTFQKPGTINESQKSPASISCRPPLPVRCSSLERPSPSSVPKNQNNLTQRQCPSPIPAHIAKELPQFQPTYANMAELEAMSQTMLQKQSPNIQLLSRALSSSNKSVASSQNPCDSANGNGHQILSSSDLSLSTIATHSTGSGYMHLEGATSTTKDDTSSTTAGRSNRSTEQGEFIDANTIPDCERELKIIETDIISNKVSEIVGKKDVSSPETEDISRASVQQKASLFEKLEREQQANNSCSNNQSSRNSQNVNIDQSAVCNKKEEIYKSSAWTEKDSDIAYEDSIKELNNLIGELDSFQREHDLNELANGRILVNPLNIFGNDYRNDYLDANNSSEKSALDTLKCNAQTTSESLKNDVNVKTIKGVEMGNCLVLDNDKNSIIYNEARDTCDLDYLKENSSIVVLRCKESSKVDVVDKDIKNSEQRLSSFRYELPSSPISTDPFDQQLPNKEIDNISKSKYNSGCAARLTRRSSSNNLKPLPPVRRSSSVTPSHNYQEPNSPNIQHDSCTNVFTESLPPPPAFLLDRTPSESTAVKVAETVKALTVIKHTPASPTVTRRAQHQQSIQSPGVQSYCTTNTSAGIYAQPKQVTKMSSFLASNPSPPKSGSNILAQINARLLPNKQSHQLQHSNESSKNNLQYQDVHQESRNNRDQTTFQSSVYGQQVPKAMHQTHQSYTYLDDIKQTSYWHDQQPTQQLDGSNTNVDKCGSILNKTKVEFLHNLNVKLAKQGLSGRAFAVRSFINSKTLPDPRLCHESLMDQIKKGATLKRNRTINDRSAPKIR